MGNGWNWVLIIAGAVLVLLEVALGGFAGFDLVLIGSALVIGGALGLFRQSTRGLHRRRAGRRLHRVRPPLGRARMRTHTVPSNTDALIGAGPWSCSAWRATSGQVRVRDEVWRADAAPGVDRSLRARRRVTVDGVDGVTLQVR